MAGSAAMIGAMEADDLTKVWRDAEGRLPPGWRLDGLRCASTGLNPGERSADWIAAAVSQNGQERRHRASDPVSAIVGLADDLSPR